ncbi:MAG: ThiF family adenylyltransferase, partial [Pseudomonadota bacterium]|nr:ThiF family adenylyltransferase [Pseudomonadota bacterium]
NPDVAVELHPVRLTAANALELVGAYDLVIECSDNFSTKFLVNDAAVLTRRPAVFASVYQYEGQLQVFKPESTHACLRCLWPEASIDGVVGNCAEAGVLGPVPGVLGSMQALLSLKVVLDLPGQLGGELLLVDFTTFSTTKLKARRRMDCVAPDCALVRGIRGDDPDIEIALPSLAAALERHFDVIDIRTGEEIGAHPSAARHIPMDELLARHEQLPQAGRYLLVCASGTRSLAAARELRKHGLRVHSLAGGLRALSRR